MGMFDFDADDRWFWMGLISLLGGGGTTFYWWLKSKFERKKPTKKEKQRLDLLIRSRNKK